ncbi:hypothetical protein FSP39_011524 [Pinctada imbricata]|uniref:Uncharacterized protein n=1 Tax=Pinctada imbricata TaxID=66713 RepID=A0AA89BZ78_PINIB|nr:hypothetical protein FSP39_011524 [Pinctada imbricata]
MTVSETSRVLEAIGVGLPLGPPPINNACLPTVYDKLDADARERVRVINGLLDHRLKVQTKILDKYKRDANRVYARERAVVENDLRRTLHRLPYMSDMGRLESKYEGRGLNVRQWRSEQYRGHYTEPKPFKELQTEKDGKPFCDRFFNHHLPVKPRMPRFVPPLQRSTDDSEQKPLSRSEKLLLTKRMSVSDNCLSSKGRLQRDIMLNKVHLPVEDDAITI